MIVWMILVQDVIFPVQNVDQTNVVTNADKIENGFLIPWSLMGFQDRWRITHILKNFKQVLPKNNFVHVDFPFIFLKCLSVLNNKDLDLKDSFLHNFKTQLWKKVAWFKLLFSCWTISNHKTYFQVWIDSLNRGLENIF